MAAVLAWSASGRNPMSHNFDVSTGVSGLGDWVCGIDRLMKLRMTLPTQYGQVLTFLCASIDVRCMMDVQRVPTGAELAAILRSRYRAGAHEKPMFSLEIFRVGHPSEAFQVVRLALLGHALNALL